MRPTAREFFSKNVGKSNARRQRLYGIAAICVAAAITLSCTSGPSIYQHTYTIPCNYMDNLPKVDNGYWECEVWISTCYCRPVAWGGF